MSNRDPILPTQVVQIKKLCGLMGIDLDQDFSKMTIEEGRVLLLALRNPKMTEKEMYELTDGKTVLKSRIMTPIECHGLNYRQKSIGDPYRWMPKLDEHAS